MAFQLLNGDLDLYRAISTEGTGLWVMGADGSDVDPVELDGPRLARMTLSNTCGR